MISSSDTVLVTGGTGFTGTYLLKALARTGCSLRVIARESSGRAAFESMDIDWHIGDVFEADVVERAMQGVNYIFHVAAAYREAKIDDDIYYKVHVESTRLLAQAAIRCPSLKRFVHVSTVGVLGHIDAPPADEKTPYNPGDVYQSTKAEAEQYILDFADQNSLPVTVVRPAAIYGPGDRRLLKLFKIAKLPVIPLIGYTKGLYHLIHVEDLVCFLMFVAVSSEAEGRVFICGNENPSSIKEMISEIADYLGRTARFIRIPAWPVFLLGDLCELVCKPFNIEPPIYRRRIAFFTKDRAFSTDQMRSIGFSPRFSDHEGLRNLCQWYQDQGWL